MGKRPSTSGRVARAAKTAKTGEPLLEILASDPSLTAACQEMLRNALPHAIASLPDERHPYQKELINVVMGICNANDAKHRAAVEADEGNTASIEQRKQQAIADLDAAKQRAAEKNEVKVARAKLMTDAQESADQAKLALTEQQTKEKATMSEKQGVIEEKTKYEEALSEAWEPLKESKLVGQRKEKNKAMTRLTAMLESTDAPDSLKSSLQLALKQKTDARTMFAEKAVEHAEKALNDHTANLKSKIEDLEAKNSEVLAAVSAAEGVLKEAEQKLHDAQDGSVVAENEWCTEETAAVHAKDACDNLNDEAAASAEALAHSKAALESVLEVNATFVELLEHRTQAVTEEGDEKMSLAKLQEDDDTAMPGVAVDVADGAGITILTEA